MFTEIFRVGEGLLEESEKSDGRCRKNAQPFCAGMSCGHLKPKEVRSYLMTFGRDGEWRTYTQWEGRVGLNLSWMFRVGLDGIKRKCWGKKNLNSNGSYSQEQLLRWAAIFLRRKETWGKPLVCSGPVRERDTDRNKALHLEL